MFASAANRRRFLKGAGVTLALPMLECLSGRPARGDDAHAPMRMLLISNNLGVLPEPFFPKQAGRDYELSPYLQELASFRGDFTVFSGLSHPGVVGGHSTENCFLTAARGPTRSGFRNKISLDQFATEALGQQTRFASLNLGVNIDKAKRSLSWTRDGALLPAEDSPAALFKRMFVQGDQSQVNQKIQELKKRGSILDAVGEDTRRLSRRIGRDDRKRLDQYLNSVRELEQRLEVAGQWEARPKPSIDVAAPQDIVDDARLFEKFELMLSMARLALETDSTRIVTLMVDAFETGVFQIDEHTQSINAYHNLSHHGQVPDKVAQLETVDRRQMKLMNQLLTWLSESKGPTGRLLDQTMVLYGSNMGDSNTHDNTNLPIMLAGGGWNHGSHIALDRESNTPLCNLFVSMLQRMGVDVESFGSSTGALSQLGG